MEKVTLKSLVFDETNADRTAVGTFEVTQENTSAMVRISIVVEGLNSMFTGIETLVPDVEVVGEMRRRLHGFATLLAEQTKDWVAP